MSKLNFRPVDISMKPMVDRYIGASGILSSEYTFTSSLIWGAGNKVHMAEHENCLYILYTFPDFPRFMLAPLCISTANYPCAIAEAEEYMRENGIALQFRGITPKMRLYFQAAGYTLTEDRNNFDYVYNTSDLLTLVGKKYHAKRNHINRFRAEHTFEYRPITRANAVECMDVYSHWVEGRDAKEYIYEIEALARAFEHMDELGLIGGGIYMDGKLAAFTIGEIGAHQAVVYFEKADSEIQGLYPLINQQFVEHALSGTQYINREEDMGIEGLRKAKLSYYPAMLLEKYKGTKNA